MSTVSVLILTRNEEKHIRDCIESCLPVADEVIVIDDGSTDQTVAIAEELGAKVVPHAMNGDWGGTTDIRYFASNITVDIFYRCR